MSNDASELSDDEYDEQLEAMLLERMEDPSPSIEATPEFWQKLRSYLEARAAKRRKSTDAGLPVDEETEAQLLEGLASPAHEFSEEDWAKKIARFRRRHGLDENSSE